MFVAPTAHPVAAALPLWSLGGFVVVFAAAYDLTRYLAG